MLFYSGGDSHILKRTSLPLDFVTLGMLFATCSYNQGSSLVFPPAPLSGMVSRMITEKMVTE